MKGTFSTIFLFFSFSLFCQDIKEAKQLIYDRRYKSAKTLLHQVLKNEPSNGEAWYLLTRAYLSLDQAHQITDSLKSAPEQLKDDPFYNVAMGSVLLEQNFPDKAKPCFELALKKTKEKNPSILAAIAQADIDAEPGNATEAVALLAKAIKRDKHNAELNTALGNAYRKLKDASKAYEAYQQAIRKDPHAAEASYKLGMIFASQKNPNMYLKYFNEAVSADSGYAPAYYQLYFHYYFKNVNKAIEYLEKYIAVSDHKIKTDYDYTDLLYLTGQFDKAIRKAQELIRKEEDNVPPRLYKLIAYSYKESGDPDKAFDYMKKYFRVAPDSIEIVKDYGTMADLYTSRKQSDSAVLFYEKAVSLEKDSAELVDLYGKLAAIFKAQKNYAQQAYWLEKYCTLNSDASNVDLFNWGIARYLNGEYQKADSVFKKYSEKYPAQDFGYFWRARSNAAIDTAMEQGLAVPHYSKLIEVAQKDTSNPTNRKHLIEAYGYLAAFEANIDKNNDAAVGYFEKLLTLDPDNETAKKYIDYLKNDLGYFKE